MPSLSPREWYAIAYSVTYLHREKMILEFARYSKHEDRVIRLVNNLVAKRDNIDYFGRANS